MPTNVIARRKSTEEERQKYGSGEYIDMSVGFQDSFTQDEADSFTKAGYEIVNGPKPAAPTGAVAADAPINRPVVESESEKARREHYQNLDRSVPDEAKIREEERARQQARIDAFNALYDEELTKARQRGAGRLGETRALGAARGVLGSEFGNQEKQSMIEANNAEERAIQAERSAKIQEVLGLIDENTRKRYTDERARAEKNTEDYLNYLKDVETGARDDIKTLAQSGIKSLDEVGKDRLKKLLEDSGYDELQATAIFNANKPKAEQVKYEYIQGKDGAIYRLGDDGSKSVIADAKPIPDGYELKTLDDGTPVVFNSATGDIKPYGAPGQYSSGVGQNQKIVKINGEDYVQNEDGSFTKPVLPDAVPSVEKVSKADEVITKIDSLLTNPNLSKAIGPQSAWVPGPLRSGTRNDIDAAIDALVASIAIENLGLLKGPMSDKDVDFIKEASSGLKKNMSEEGFKKRLEELKNKFVEIKNKAQSAPEAPQVDEEAVGQLQRELGISRDEALKALGFNLPLSMGENGSEVKKIAAAIKQVESGGNYNAKGASGEGGAYQFMPATWRQWAGQYLGSPNAPQTPENQDRVAEAKISDLLRQGYDAREIALIWNGGEPTVKRGVNKYGVRYDSGAYAEKVLGQLKSLV